MPNLCWSTSDKNPNVAAYENIDFTVTWNKDVTGVMNYSAKSFKNHNAVENILCDISRTADTNMVSGTTYTEAGRALKTVAGFSR